MRVELLIRAIERPAYDRFFTLNSDIIELWIVAHAKIEMNKSIEKIVFSTSNQLEKIQTSIFPTQLNWMLDLIRFDKIEFTAYTCRLWLLETIERLERVCPK